MSSGLPDFGRNLTFHSLRRDYRGFQMGEQTEQHTDCSSDRCFPCTHDRCLTALVYLRTCTVGECLRINDLHFLAARWRRPLVCPAFPYSPCACRTVRRNHAFRGRTEPSESGNNSFGSGASVVLADVSCRHYHDRLCILRTLCADGTV